MFAGPRMCFIMTAVYSQREAGLAKLFEKLPPFRPACFECLCVRVSLFLLMELCCILSIGRVDVDLITAARARQRSATREVLPSLERSYVFLSFESCALVENSSSCSLEPSTPCIQAFAIVHRRQILSTTMRKTVMQLANPHKPTAVELEDRL